MPKLLRTIWAKEVSQIDGRDLLANLLQKDTEYEVIRSAGVVWDYDKGPVYFTLIRVGDELYRVAEDDLFAKKG